MSVVLEGDGERRSAGGRLARNHRCVSLSDAHLFIFHSCLETSQICEKNRFLVTHNRIFSGWTSIHDRLNHKPPASRFYVSDEADILC